LPSFVLLQFCGGVHLALIGATPLEGQAIVHAFPYFAAMGF
jgi:hypothetical protein